MPKISFVEYPFVIFELALLINLRLLDESGEPYTLLGKEKCVGCTCCLLKLKTDELSLLKKPGEL